MTLRRLLANVGARIANSDSPMVAKDRVLGKFARWLYFRGR